MWKAKVFISDHADMCYTHLSRVFCRLNMPGGGGGALNVEVIGMLVGNFFGEP